MASAGASKMNFSRTRLLRISAPALLVVGLFATSCSSNQDASSALLGQIPTNGPTTTVPIGAPTAPCSGETGVAGQSQMVPNLET